MSPPLLRRTLQSQSPEQTHALGVRLGGLLQPGDFIGLIGDLGAGKTHFVRGVADGAGVARSEVASPTFAIVYPYRGRVPLYHADLYRLSTQHEVADLALAELAESEGIVLVEWGDVVATSLGDHLAIRIEQDATDEQARELTLHAVGRSWAKRWERVEAAVAVFAC